MGENLLLNINYSEFKNKISHYLLSQHGIVSDLVIYKEKDNFTLSDGEYLLPKLTPGFTDNSSPNKEIIPISVKITNFLRFDIIKIKKEITEFLTIAPTLEEINDFMDIVDNYLPILNGDEAYFVSGDGSIESKSIKEQYEEKIGYDRLLIKKNELNPIISESTEYSGSK